MMQKVIDTTGLTFDDVLLVPNFTDIRRDDVDLSVDLTADIRLSLPLLSSPMDTVTTADLAIALGKLGGLGVIHRNLSIADQVKEVKKVKKADLLSAAAVGVGKDLEKRTEELIRGGIDVIVVDSAHGQSKGVIEATEYIAKTYKQVALISGNVATAGGAKALIEAGADCLRVGMGPGSICTTRVVTGVGMPQITALFDTVSVASSYGVPVIADGGVRFSGDILKALAAGANLVMVGSLLAATKEAPGKMVTVSGKKYKTYRGMGSGGAMREGSAMRYGQEYRRGQEKKLIAEGVEGMVPYKGTVEEVVNQLVGGVRSGMYYVGAAHIKDLHEKARFIRITQASLTESHPHDILIK